MDFSFVDDVPTTGAPRPVDRASAPAAGGTAALSGQKRPLFQIPSYAEVQRAERRDINATNLFQPSGLVFQALQGHQQPYPAQAGNNLSGQLPSSTSVGVARHGLPPTIPGLRSQSAGSIDRTRQPQHAQAGAQPVAAPAYPQAPPQGAAQQHNPNQALPHSNAGAHLTYAANHGPYQGLPPMTGAGTAGATTAINAYTPQLYAQNPATQQQQNAQPAMPPPSRAPQAHQPMPANAIIVSKRQQGNPVLKHIRNVRWQFADIVPDYQLGASAAGLFLSLRYHMLHPEYILYRMKELQRAYRLTVLLVHVDVDDAVRPLGDITRAAVHADCTLVCAWSAEECARWLETFKSYENKPANAIQERTDQDYASRLASALSSVRGVNKTDAITLGANFGSLAAILQAPMETLAACPGIGPTKVRRLFEAFNEPFRKELRPFTLPPTAAAAPNSARTAAAAVTVGAANATAAAADTRANNSGLAATRGRSQSLVRAVNGGTSPSDASLDHGLGSEGVYGVRGLLAQTPNSTSTADDLVRQGLELRQLDGGNHLRADHASAAASSSETHAAADSQQELGYPADSVDAETNIEASDNAEGVQGGWAWVLTQRLLPGDDFYDDDGEDDVVDV